jgi:hypothetical protein
MWPGATAWTPPPMGHLSAVKAHPNSPMR